MKMIIIIIIIIIINGVKTLLLKKVVSNFKIKAENTKTKSIFKFLSMSGSIPPGGVYKNKV